MLINFRTRFSISNVSSLFYKNYFSSIAITNRHSKLQLYINYRWMEIEIKYKILNVHLMFYQYTDRICKGVIRWIFLTNRRFSKKLILCLWTVYLFEIHTFTSVYRHSAKSIDDSIEYTTWWSCVRNQTFYNQFLHSTKKPFTIQLVYRGSPVVSKWI